MTTARDRVLVRAHDRTRVSLALLAGDASAEPPPRWAAPLMTGALVAVVLAVATALWPQAVDHSAKPMAPPAHVAKHRHHGHKKADA